MSLPKEVNKEGPMAVLLIKCPHTNRSISIGIDVFRHFSQVPDVLSHLECPECGLEHAWWTREAWLQDEGKMSAPEDEAA